MTISAMSESSVKSITTFDRATTQDISEMLKAQHVRLAQLDRPTKERTLTARNYGSAIIALGDYLAHVGSELPTKSILTSWRDDMLAGRAPKVLRKKTGEIVSTTYPKYNVRTANARLSAARKLLRAVADDVTNITIKIVLKDWANVEDAKETAIADEDRTESDFGRRFSVVAARQLILSPDTSNLKGLRDRALIALMLGAGLRVSEVANLTMKDMFSTVNEKGQPGIKVVRGKHNKTRVVVLNGWNSWVFKAVKAYTNAIDLTPLEHSKERVFRGVKVATRGKMGKVSRQALSYISAGSKITARNIELAMSGRLDKNGVRHGGYQALYDGEMVYIACHDLRRTYAKISKQTGMTFEALRKNMGHSSQVITERYVGSDVDWSERMPTWDMPID